MLTRDMDKLLREINLLIEEREKGNTDFQFDIDAFKGGYKVLAENILELSSLGIIDQLTGLPNRRSFDNRMELEWNRAMRDKAVLSILMLDVDKFKLYNDTFGHLQGDEALKTVAATLKESIKRTVDLVARWGGEEFVVLLPNTDSDGAYKVAEYIRGAIEKAVIPCVDEKASHITVSIGVKTLVPDPQTDIIDLITEADKALYIAKGLGRNRVCRYDKDLLVKEQTV